MVAQATLPFFPLPCGADSKSVPAPGRKRQATYRQTGTTHSIREWPTSEQPRERLRRHGAAGLSSAELLSIVLRAGSPGEDAVALASRLLVEHGGLAGLGKATESELAAMRGMGQAKAAALQAALELGRRLLLDTGEERLRIQAPGDIGPRLVLEMGDLEYECLRVVLLNTRHLVLAMPIVYQGCVNHVSIRNCELFRHAVRHNATALIVAHNHPSGDPTPSPEDVTVTRMLVEAGKLMDIEVLDHLVISTRGYVSLKERRLGF